MIGRGSYAVGKFHAEGTQMGEQQDNKAEEFAAKAHGRRSSLIGEFLSFLAHNKKWWLLPILVVLLVMGLLVLAGASGISAFLYTLF